MTTHANDLFWRVLGMPFPGRIPNWQLARMERLAFRSPRRFERRRWANRPHPMRRLWRKAA